MADTVTLNQVFISILIALVYIFCLVALAVGVLKKLFRWDQVLETQENLGTSRFAPAIAFFIFRVLAFLFILSTFISFCVKLPNHAVTKYFIFWNYVLLGIYFFLASIFSFRHVVTRHTFEPKTATSAIACSLWILFQTGLVIGVICSIGFWAATYSTSLYKQAFTDSSIGGYPYEFYCSTIATFVLIIIEWILNKLPVMPEHVIFPLIWGSCFASYLVSINPEYYSIVLPVPNKHMNLGRKDDFVYFLMFYLLIIAVHMLFAGLEKVKQLVAPKREYLPN